MMANHGSELFVQEGPPLRFRPGLAARLLHAIELALGWREAARQRRAVLTLDERLLKDIGITRADAEREASRRLWDLAPESWRDWR